MVTQANLLENFNKSQNDNQSLQKLSNFHWSLWRLLKSQTDVTFALTCSRITIVYSRTRKASDWLLWESKLIKLDDIQLCLRCLIFHEYFVCPKARSHTLAISFNIYDSNMKCHLWKSALRNEQICMQKRGKISNKNQSFEKRKRKFIFPPAEKRCHMKYDESLSPYLPLSLDNEWANCEESKFKTCIYHPWMRDDAFNIQILEKEI